MTETVATASMLLYHALCLLLTEALQPFSTTTVSSKETICSERDGRKR